MRSILIKPLILFGLALLLAVPLTLVNDVITERSNNRHYVVQDIASSWTERQSISGPWLIIYYEQTQQKKEFDKEKKEYVLIDKVIPKQMLVRAQKQRSTASLDVEYRYRNIYKVPTYKAKMNIQSEFDLESAKQILDKEKNINIISAKLSLGVSDSRGFIKSPKLFLNSKDIKTIPGAVGRTINDGFHAEIANFDINRTAFKTTAEFELRGIVSFAIEASAMDIQSDIISTWPDPSFFGSFLPSDRVIDENGFTAKWELTSFATGAHGQTEILKPNEEYFPSLNAQLSFGVRLFDPINIYTLSDRATKYGMLIIVIIFGAFFLFEVLTAIRVNPMQYLFVGLALSMFFLLLLSLSEVIGFSWAYLLATIASSSLISFYIKPAMGMRGYWIMLSLLLVLYISCYLILMLEKHALLFGSLLLFLVLAVMMITTRHINWYALSNPFNRSSHSKEDTP